MQRRSGRSTGHRPEGRPSCRIAVRSPDTIGGNRRRHGPAERGIGASPNRNCAAPDRHPPEASARMSGTRDVKCSDSSARPPRPVNADSVVPSHGGCRPARPASAAPASAAPSPRSSNRPGRKVTGLVQSKSSHRGADVFPYPAIPSPMPDQGTNELAADGPGDARKRRNIGPGGAD